jgi:hypothetical protein
MFKLVFFKRAKIPLPHCLVPAMTCRVLPHPQFFKRASFVPLQVLLISTLVQLGLCLLFYFTRPMYFFVSNARLPTNRWIGIV